MNAPPAFPDKRFLEHLAAAAAKILNPAWGRKVGVQIAVSELTAALHMMAAEKAALERERDRVYEDNQRKLRESRAASEPPDDGGRALINSERGTPK